MTRGQDIKSLILYKRVVCVWFLTAWVASSFLSSFLCSFLQAGNSAPVHIVGSASMFPFLTAVVEHFSYSSSWGAPIVEATGTGGGIKIFCSGKGSRYPDMVAASRPISAQEKAFCQKMGITSILELQIGYDGLILARSSESSVFSLTLNLLRQALKERGSQDEAPSPLRWSEVDSHLPPEPILFFGPPPTSGTRQFFEELMHTPSSRTLRSDGAFTDTSEQEVFTAYKIRVNPHAIGIFSYGFYQANQHHLRVFPINHVFPTFQTIANQTYPLTRPLYFYVKKISHHPNLLQAFVRYLMDPDTTGQKGYLKFYGFIPLPDPKHRQEEEKVLKFFNLHDKKHPQ